MQRIVILDEQTANQIAAGEVIERPASIIKELTENSIDAGANRINVEIKNGGISYIRIQDNGSGIHKDDVKMAFERHGTSKIHRVDDLNEIKTMGFRGEALASIAAVSDIAMTTKTDQESVGTKIRIKGGKLIEYEEAACPVGTTVFVRNLFFNTPARYKFLKTDTTEGRAVLDALVRIALSHPSIAFSITGSQGEMLRTPGDGKVQSVIYAAYGRQTAGALMDVHYEDEYAKIDGYCGKAEIASGNRSRQTFFVNKRVVKDRVCTAALEQAYKTILMKNRYPFAVLFITINPNRVDVNVHPTKTQVRFSDEQAVFRSVYHAVSNAVFAKKDGKNTPDVAYVVQKSKHNHARAQEQTPPSSELLSKKEREVKKTNDVQKPLYEKNEVDVERRKSDEQKREDFSNKDAPYKQTQPKRKDDRDNTLEESTLSKVTGRHENHVITSLKNKNQDSEPVQENDSLFGSYTIIGVLFRTYIVLEQNNRVILIDQHAAHEKIIYERLQSNWKKDKKIPTQVLLQPQKISLDHEQADTIETYEKQLYHAGYRFDSIGSDCVQLKEIPYLGVDVSAKELFFDVLSAIEKGKGVDVNIMDDLIYATACKAAIKAQNRLHSREVDALIARLSGLKDPRTCPHGRPVYITVDRKDMEKRFGRT